MFFFSPWSFQYVLNFLCTWWSLFRAPCEVYILWTPPSSWMLHVGLWQLLSIGLHVKKISFHIEVKGDIPYGCKHIKRSCHGGGHYFKIVPSIFKNHHGNHTIIWIVNFFWDNSIICKVSIIKFHENSSWFKNLFKCLKHFKTLA